MHLARIALVFLPIALCSCAAPADRMSFDPAPKPRVFAWDGSGNDPNKPRVRRKRTQILADENSANREREEALTSLRPYSTAWWTIYDQIEAEHDKRLARKLVICVGCSGHELQNDVTATIPRR
jgi:hypothetical protein